MRKIKAVKGTHAYCGPAAYSIITGKSSNRVDKLMKRKVTWMYTSELRHILEQEGLKVERLQLGAKRPTLRVYLSNHRKGEHYNDLLLVNTSTHFCVVQANKFCDNHARTPCKLDDSHHLRAKVSSVYRIA